MMPIKDRSKYPPNWRELSKSIRNGRAGGRCECTGECGAAFCRHGKGELGAGGVVDLDGRCNAPNGLYVQRHEIVVGLWRISTARDRPGGGWKKPVKIVLTVAHLDHDPTNNDLENLKALCQRCHNALDAPHRANNASRTRRRKKLDAVELAKLKSIEPFIGRPGAHRNMLQVACGGIMQAGVAWDPAEAGGLLSGWIEANTSDTMTTADAITIARAWHAIVKEKEETYRAVCARLTAAVAAFDKGG